jgi:hypothetical protein
MASSRFIWDNFVFADGMVITASTELVNRPAAYVAHPSRTRRWQSATNTSDAWVAVDFGSNRTFDSICLVDWQGKGGDIKAQSSPDGSVWTDIGSAFVQPSPNQTRILSKFFPSTPVTRRHVRALFQHSGGASSARLGVLVVGLAYVPGRDLAEAPQLDRADPSVISQSIGRQEYAHSREKYFMVSGRFPSLEDADQPLWQAMFEEIGSSRPCIMSYDYEKAEHTYYGRLTTNYTRAHQLGLYHDIPFSFMEVL